LRQNKLDKLNDLVRKLPTMMNMRRLSFLAVLVWLSLYMAVPAQSAETYFTFEITSRAELVTLTRVVSIDNVKGNTVYAYANDKELEALRDLGYSVTILPHPGSLITPRMSSDPKDLQEWDTYPTYDAYWAMMHQFAADYPSLCAVDSVGYTVQGRAILFARISDNIAVEEDEPEVMYTSSMHGDETAGYILTLRLIDYLLTNYGTDTQVTSLVDSLEIWINPLANPDGTYRSGNYTVFGAYRYNANWVDINRNFADPDEGPHPDGNAWQPETIAMMDLADANSFVLSANFHGGAEVVNYPWDTWPRRHADDDWWQETSRDYADLAQANSPPGYMTDLNNGITNGWDWYTISGGRQDLMNYWHGCREVTIELSHTKLLPESSLNAWWDYNRDALLNYLEKALRGVRGIVTDAATGDPLAAFVHIPGHDVDIDSSVARTDPDVGNYHRMLAPGTYDLEFIADGYVSQTITDVVVIADQFVRLDVALSQEAMCDCPYQGDTEPDGFIDALDLAALIDILFASGNNPKDSLCPMDRFDLDCDDFTTSLDLTVMIDHLFAAGPGPCDPCAL
jgi:hypothetical protein